MSTYARMWATSRSLWALLAGLCALACSTTPAAGGLAVRARTHGSESATPSEALDPAAYYHRSHAVVIGVNAYESLPPLDGAVRDARSIAELLQSQGFEVTLLLDAEATRRAVVRELGDRLPERLGENDRLLIYFAGHGVTTGQGERALGYLMPVDGVNDEPTATGVSMADLQQWFHRYEAKHVLFVADACYSGLALRTRATPVSSRSSNYVEMITSNSVRFSLVAGTAGQEAAEYLGRGVFTFFLERAIRGEADTNWDGLVTTTEVQAYVQPLVAATVARVQGEAQLPQYARSGTGEFVFFATRPDTGERPARVSPAEPVLRGEPLNQVRSFLIVSAIDNHQRAQQLRRECVEQRLMELCLEAKSYYRASAEAYGLYIAAFPDNPEAVELQYNCADALFWSEQYAEAAIAYARVRDLGGDHRVFAARAMVESLQRLLDQIAVDDPTVVTPTEIPGSASSDALPEAVAQLLAAREAYVTTVSRADDVEGLRDAYRYENARTLALYGHFEDAAVRADSLVRESCATSSVARRAYDLFRVLAERRGDSEALRTLTHFVTTQGCIVEPDGPN